MTDLPRDEWLVEPGFEHVAAEFERNFGERGEVGAAFAAVLGGSPVVDLWGGTASRPQGRPWRRDTMQLIFSGTKGLVAICLLMLVERGKLRLDSRVAEYWPEFAAAGKEEVTVRQVVTHTARLPGLVAPVLPDDILEPRRMADLLAAQGQLEDPRAARAYHPLTFGWICGELIRRVEGRSAGAFLAEEVAGPAGLEVFLGLPAGLEPRVSRLDLRQPEDADDILDPAAPVGDELMATVWGNPDVWSAASFPWNDPRFHRAEIPGVNAIGTAGSIAALFGSLDHLLAAETLEIGTVELERRVDELVGEPQAFGVGFALQTESMPFGPPADAFGHTGVGGSVQGRWPGVDLGFSYVTNLMLMGYRDGEDPRPRALLGALHDSVVRQGG